MNIEIKNILAVLPKGDGYEVKETNIYIKGDTIEKIGDKPDGFTAEKVLEGKDRLAIPGLINSHTHTYMSVFRNLADDLSFEDWLFKNVMPREDKLTNEDAYWGAMLACAEMIKTGTTTFLDMHMFKNQTINAANKTGMRAVISRGLAGNGMDEGAVRRLREAKEEMEYAKDMSRISFMLAPHAIYTCDREYLQIIVQEAKKMNLPIHLHLSEAKSENAQTMESDGISAVEYAEKLGIFDVKTILAHCVQVNEKDMDILAKHNVSVAANPKSNLKLANGIAPIYQMLDKGINVCIGTDSCASNNTLNMFSDMNYTALLHKGTNGDPTAVTAEQVFKMATENAAKALNLENVTGAIKEGLKADIAILDLNCPQFVPRQNLVAALSYSANGSEVDTVIIDGEIVMENGKLTLVDEAEIYVKANEVMERLK